MAEQDTYASHLGVSPDKAHAAIKAYDLRHSTGAEQERYASHFTVKRPDKVIDTTWSPLAAAQPGGSTLQSEQETLGRHFHFPHHHALDTSAVGILRSTLLPSFGLQSGLSIIAYAGSRATNRVDGKDWLWPSAQVINAWWNAVGKKVLCDHSNVSTAWSALDYPHKLILSGVTLWGGRLFYRLVSRSITRQEEPRYESAKAEPDFWNRALFSVFLPEAAFQSLISLPFTLPFTTTEQRFTPHSVPTFAELATGFGVFLFAAGFALETLADTQLAKHHEKNDKDLNTAGVWSLVRHPNYLGDALVHASFPLVLYGAGLMHPLAVLGPIANYVFLRFVGGDKENEAFQEQHYFKDKSPKYAQLQEYKANKNSFWPSLDEFQNPWLWSVATIGIAGVMVERVIGRR